MTTYGFANEAWFRARDEAFDAMSEVARQQSLISYSELTAKIHSIRLEPDSHALAALLDEINRDEDFSAHGMLSVVVVHKGSDGMPGQGFFTLARQLNKAGSDDIEIWMNELKAVHSYWSKAPA